jgi:hypothetical protein
MSEAITASPMLQRLYGERNDLVSFVDRTVQGANDAKRDLSPSEQETLANTRKRMGELDAQIKPLEEFEQDKARSAQLTATYVPQPQGSPAGLPQGNGLGADQSSGVRTEARATQYRTRGEVMVDHIRAAGLAGRGYAQGVPDEEARRRLLSAGVIPPGANPDEIRMAQRNDQTIRSGMDQARVTQVSGDTPGIMPVPIIGEVMNDVDNARPFIDSVGAKPLDFAGETFKRPLITQHVAMGKQTTQATSTGLGSQKMTIGSVTFTKETWGGWLDVSRQDLDWSSPSAWDALLTDFTDQYGLVTENAAGDAFAAAVTATVENADAVGALTLPNLTKAMYAAAALAYAGAGRLPDTIWLSLDMWGLLGPAVESQVPTMNNDVAQTNIGDFQAGNLLKLPRVVVPSMPAGTIIVGARRWTEVYEERIGLLQAVNPSILGVQIAYGGYVAYNTIKPGAFAKVINAA